MNKWYKSTDEEVKLNDFDKERLTKIEEFVADMAEPHMVSEEYFIFNNETLNIFFVKFIEMIDEMKERGNFLNYVDENGQLKLAVLVQKVSQE